MRNSQLIQQEISETEAKLKALEAEYNVLSDAFSSETKAIYAKIDQENRKLDTLKEPKVSPLFLLGIIVMIALGILGGNLGLILQIPCFVIAIILVIIRSSKKKSLKAQFENQKDEINNQIFEYEFEVNEIESKNPRIHELKEGISELEYALRSLKQEFSDAFAAEKAAREEAESIKILGVNNVLVHVSPTVEGPMYKLSTAYITIDGTSRGIVAQPFSIISLSPGIHSISITFDIEPVFSSYSAQTITTHDVQFSVRDDNKYFTFKLIFNYDTLRNKLSYNIDATKPSELSGFLTESKLSRSDFNSYLSNL